MMSGKESRSNDAGFTVVEFIVGAVILVIVCVGAYSLFAGAGQSGAKNAVQDKISATSELISEELHSNPGWLTKPCKEQALNAPEGCNVASYFSETPDPALGLSPTQVEQAKALAKKIPDVVEMSASKVIVKGIDSPSDGVGKTGPDRDKDGVLPDFYRISITLAVKGETVEKLKVKPTFESATTVDPTLIGKATGTLVVNVCQIINQADDRMPIEGCNDNLASTEMKKQPACANSNEKNMECNDALNAADRFDKSYNTAFGASQVRAMKLHEVKFKITNDSGFVLHSDSDLAVREGGAWVFPQVPAGKVKVTILSPGIGADTTELWSSKSIPSNWKLVGGNLVGVASVQSNQRARTLVMFRPKTTEGTYRVGFTRKVYPYVLKPVTYSRSYWLAPSCTSCGVVRKKITVNVRYVEAWGPYPETWGGPAHDGIVAIAAKPYGRHTEKVHVGDHYEYKAHVNQQVYQWEGGNNPDYAIEFQNLPTGLHSLPVNATISDAMVDRIISEIRTAYGVEWTSEDDEFQTYRWTSTDISPSLRTFNPTDVQRTVDHRCAGISNGDCNKFVWINPDETSGTFGAPNGKTTFHTDKGECIVNSAARPAPFNNMDRYPEVAGNPYNLGQRCNFRYWATDGRDLSSMFKSWTSAVPGRGDRYMTGYGVGFGGGYSGYGGAGFGTVVINTSSYSTRHRPIRITLSGGAPHR